MKVHGWSLSNAVFVYLLHLFSFFQAYTCPHFKDEITVNTGEKRCPY